MGAYENGAFDLGLLDIVDLLGGHYEIAVLVPPVHVDLLDLVTEQ